MPHTEPPSLPDWIQAAYASLEPHLEAESDGIPRTEAQDILLADATVVEETSDATYALDRLLDRGWLYEVNAEVRKTIDE